MSELLNNYKNELYHYGVLGMKWGRRKDSKGNYRSTGLRSAIARRKNEKVDESFKNWNENAKRKADAISLGKKANVSKMAYEKDKSNKDLKNEYKQSNKEYKKALKGNTTYRKGDIKREVGSDLSRKYLSEAKRVKKQLDQNPTDKNLQKKYSDLMSKHDVERAKARRAPEVAAKRSRKKASIKRAMTMTVKAAAATTAIGVGTHYVNKYLADHQYTLNGKDMRVNPSNVVSFGKYVKMGKDILGYF